MDWLHKPMLASEQLCCLSFQVASARAATVTSQRQMVHNVLLVHMVCFFQTLAEPPCAVPTIHQPSSANGISGNGVLPSFAELPDSFYHCAGHANICGWDQRMRSTQKICT